MKQCKIALAAIVLVSLAGEVQAQFGPPPLPPPPVFVSGNGIGFVYGGRNLLVAGSFGSRVYGVGLPAFSPYPLYSPAPWAPVNVFPYPLATYGVQQNRIIIQSIHSSPVTSAGYYRVDPTAGIDLDALPPKKAPIPAPVPDPVPPFAKTPPRPLDPVPEPGPQLPGVDVSKPKPAVRPEDPVPDPQPEIKPPPPAPPKVNEALRMRQGGETAFHEGRYGLALLRLIQATELDKADARARFLLGQAHFALGKYAEAVTAIQQGLQLDKNWPNTDFKPRVQLYPGHETELNEQIKRLEDVAKSKPNDATFGFLLAYQYWFDGRRAEAVTLFRNHRAQGVDSVCVDMFLNAAMKPGEVARK